MVGEWCKKYAKSKLRTELKKYIKSIYHLSATIEWDGSPIYFHNFENRQSYGYIGDLTGSIIESIGEEVMYNLNSGKRSSGQKMFYQFLKLSKLMSKTVTYEDILAEPRQKYGSRKNDDLQDPWQDPWKMCYDVQEEYYKSFPMAYDKSGQNTYLFDEIDKSMDILNINRLYTKILPGMSEKYGQQIIIISHSPIVLKDEIYKSDKYNFISMDEGYTEECRKMLFGQ